MDSSARRVKAERDRRRLPSRGPVARWVRRITGLLATAAFLGVGFVSAQMILPDGGEESVIEEAPAATQEPTPEPKAKEAKKPKRPKPLTRAQRRAREDAVAEVRAQGFTTLKPTDYDPRATLRVLIARPVGDAAGGYRAFFFLKDRYLGRDALGPSTILKIAKPKGKRTITLSYGVYGPGDAAGEPSGRKKVRFRLVDERIQALDTVPPDAARFQRREGDEGSDLEPDG
jgi:hypothetical protein